jgi:hypothetical protein
VKFLLLSKRLNSEIRCLATRAKFIEILSRLRARLKKKLFFAIAIDGRKPFYLSILQFLFSGNVFGVERRHFELQFEKTGAFKDASFQ